MTIVIDNASFHKSKKIDDLIEQAGCELLYLPPYSPDLNPIEKYWHKLKTQIKKKMRDFAMTLENAMEWTLNLISNC